MTEKNTTHISDEELDAHKDLTRDDAPEGPELGADFWDRAKLVMPRTKQHMSLRLDPDIVAFFKAQGKGWQTRMNAVLRSYVEAHRNESRE